MTYEPLANELILDLRPRGRAIQGDEARQAAPSARFSLQALLAQMLERLRDRFASQPYEPIDPDPIDHPAFRGMSQRDLADMPFPRYSITEAAQTADDRGSA